MFVKVVLLLIIYYIQTFSQIPENLNNTLLLKQNISNGLFKIGTREIDTLEIFILYTQFKQEIPDNSLTTGLGVFDSDSNSKFKLNPRGFRQYKFYLSKHLEYAKNYLNKASLGKITITWKSFPQPNNGGFIENPITLSQTISFYNPAKKDEETTASHNQRRALGYMSFVAETLKKANTQDSIHNPFTQPPTNNRVFRAYLIFHAGHSRLGNLSTPTNPLGNTPNDLIDIFVTATDFKLLNNITNPNPSDSLLPNKQDTLGIRVANNQIINQLMVLSESASQDNIDFGIQGILIHQILSQIGLPNTFDISSGNTRLGLFDAMDLGRFAHSGFFPTLPSAWLRLYMGWNDIQEARPTNSQYPLPVCKSLSSLQCLLKIPINDEEYFLLENRQQYLDQNITIHFSKPQFPLDKELSINDSVTVPVSFLDSLFLDSLCEGSNCVVNNRKPQGVITSISDYDVGIPAGGVLIWRVNEWAIRQSLSEGYINATQNGFPNSIGIELVEADGEQSITALSNQASYQVLDVGFPSDVFPHILLKNNQKDTINYLLPNGISNTRSWNDGQTHFALEITLPQQNFTIERNTNRTGDTVFYYNTDTFSVRIHWNTQSNISKITNSQFPLPTQPVTHPSNIAYLKNQETIVLMGNSGILQLLDSTGNSILNTNNDTLILNNPFENITNVFSAYPDSSKIVIQGISKNFNSALGVSLFQDSIIIAANDQNLYFIQLSQTDSFNTHTILDPIIYNNLTWIINEQSQLQGYNLQGLQQSLSLPQLNYQGIAAIEINDNESGLVLISDSARITLVNLSSQNVSTLLEPNKNSYDYLNITVSDFNKNGKDDLFILSNKHIDLVSQNGSSFFNYPYSISKSDSLPASVTDINQDGYPDILFSNQLGLTAVTYKREILWNFKPQPLNGQSISITSSALSLSKSNSTMILVSSSNGLIWMLDHLGIPVENSSYQLNIGQQTPDWPLAAGSYNNSNNSNKIFLSLLSNNNQTYLASYSSKGVSNLWKMNNVNVNNTHWITDKGSFKRNARFDANHLTEVLTPAVSNSIHQFYLYPSPINTNTPNIKLNVGNSTQKIVFKVFNLSGYQVFKTNLSPIKIAGSYNLPIQLKLGTGVYLGVIEVTFIDNSTKTKYQRFGVL